MNKNYNTLYNYNTGAWQWAVWGCSWHKQKEEVNYLFCVCVCVGGGGGGGGGGVGRATLSFQTNYPENKQQ